MDQETAYLTALGEVRTFSVTGDQLTLSDANNKSILVYQSSVSGPLRYILECDCL